MTREKKHSEIAILNEIRFGFIHPYNVAGMAEPWLEKLKLTLDLLKSNGIGSILTLTEDDLYGKYYHAAGLLHLHEPINDCEAPSKKGMDRAISFINSSIETGHGVAVHCLEGRGRTGTVLCAWLAQKEFLAAEDAVRRICEIRECTVITDAQREFLFRYIINK